MLGEPIIIETLPDGNVWAVYEYTARLGKSMGWIYEGNALNNWFGLEVWSAGLAEFMMMPMAYVGKDKHTYQKEFVYDANGMIVASYPERDKNLLSQSGWAACAKEADRVLPGVHATEVWRTHVRHCVEGNKTGDAGIDATKVEEVPKKD